MLQMMKRKIALPVLGLSGLLLAAVGLGCGGADQGPQRFDVSGNVTFNGQPVPRGTIIFEPNAAAGNNGPQGFAKIVDGHYDTREGGKGVVGGPHWARVEGLKAAVGEQPPQPLFQDYRIQIDLPKESTTHDFEVPAEAGKNVVPVVPA